MEHSKNHIKKSKFKIDEVTIVLIVAVIAIIVGVYHDRNNQRPMDAEKITSLLMDDHDISFASGGVVNLNKLAEVQKMDYPQLKEYLKTDKDFCLYLVDEKGTIILAKGSSRLTGDGIGCK